MIRVIRLTCLIALPLALAACGDKEPDAKATAAGEILEGTTSDAMLPLDTVRSQPPLAPRTETVKADGKKGDAVAEDEAAEGPAAPTDVATTPAVAPTITVPTAPTPPAATKPAMK
ncbi:MAG: hypothetical protein ABWZ75_01165 [Novosphingobium sp.]